MSKAKAKIKDVKVRTKPCGFDFSNLIKPKARPHFCIFNFYFFILIFHEGKPHNWHDLWRSWAWEPVVLILLALSAFLYWRGVRLLWREASAGRGIKRWEAACFMGGWLTLFTALVSPLHPWGRVLFSAHMTQHELLMLVAAPLFVLSRPLLPFLWALPMSWARVVGGWAKIKVVQTVWRGLTNPLVAWAVHAVALWVWHAPALFDATINSELVHTLQHLSFFLSALLFWWALVHGPQGIMGYGAATLYMFTTSIHSGILGALITFATSLWYPAYRTTTESWGLTPLEDQQLGGLIMWIPAGLVYIVAGLMLFAGWLRETEARVIKRESAQALRQG